MSHPWLELAALRTVVNITVISAADTLVTMRFDGLAVEILACTSWCCQLLAGRRPLVLQLTFRDRLCHCSDVYNVMYMYIVCALTGVTEQLLQQ